ncbi:23393_t:CDS:1, partial [Gigaspora margarita]
MKSQLKRTLVKRLTYKKEKRIQDTSKVNETALLTKYDNNIQALPERK